MDVWRNLCFDLDQQYQGREGKKPVLITRSFKRGKKKGCGEGGREGGRVEKKFERNIFRRRLTSMHARTVGPAAIDGLSDERGGEAAISTRTRISTDSWLTATGKRLSMSYWLPILSAPCELPKITVNSSFMRYPSVKSNIHGTVQTWSGRHCVKCILDSY